MLFLDEFGFAEPTFRALDAAVDFFLGGDDRGVGLGEQRIEGTLEEVFLDGGHVPVRPWLPGRPVRIRAAVPT